MLPIPHIKSSPTVITKYPNRFQKSLWMASHGLEPMLLPVSPTRSQKIHYLDNIGNVRPILYLMPEYFTDAPPLVVILGTLLHPSLCGLHELPWVKSVLASGQALYFITHRGHHFQSDESMLQSHDYEDVAVEDISTAIGAIQQHCNHREIDLIGAGLGSILTLFWLMYNGASRVRALHLLPPTHQILPKFRYRIASKLGRRFSMKSLWNYHLSLQILDDWLETFTLSERSFLVHSDSWLDATWINALLDWTNSQSIRLSSGGLLTHALPSLDNVSVHHYASNKTTPNTWMIPPKVFYRQPAHSLPDTAFPILHPEFQLGVFKS